MCTERWKLNLFLLDDSELYDLQADPHEMTNLIADPAHAAIRADLAQRIVDWVDETGDPLAPIVANAPHGRWAPNRRLATPAATRGSR